MEPVVIAGVAFYLDHENQIAIPVEPTALPAEQSSLSKSNSKASLSKYTGSKQTSAAITPMASSPRKVSFNTQEYA